MSLEAWLIYFSCLSFFGGACIGSFLNVCIFRIPEDLSVVKPRSYCPLCKRPIPWYENIPIISWLLLRAKCRGCKAKISPQYVLVELMTAVIFLGLWKLYGPSTQTGIYMLMVSGLILGTFVDFKEMYLPDRVTIGGMIAGVALSTAFPELHSAANHLAGLKASLMGMALGAGILQTVRVLGTMAFKKEAMGFGDVKLLGAIGAFLGWESILFCLLASSLVGVFVGVSLILSKNNEWGGRIPFGPYLALAAVLWIFGGDHMWEAYLTWIAGGHP